MSLLDLTLKHLENLVRFDTTNPPRAIEADQGIFAYLKQALPDFDLQLFDLGEGCLSLYARRGEPDLLVNVHVDTVPADENYTADPWTLRITNDRAIGLGACDIKGAAACLLAAAQTTDGPAALLFTSDEEAGSSRCVRDFTARKPHDYQAVFVAEPTMAQAVTGHRGIRTFTANFSGRAGHSSGPTALEDNALHQAARWIARAVDQAEQDLETLTYDNLRGTCFNVGVVQGGKKPNIVAPNATVRWGIRPLPGQDADALARRYFDLALDPARAIFTPGFSGPSLPAIPGKEATQQAEIARQIAEAAGIPQGQAVNFWTEAALFSQAGFPTLVFGPGHIDQAHTADEWVALDQLELVASRYQQLLSF